MKLAASAAMRHTEQAAAATDDNLQPAAAALRQGKSIQQAGVYMT